MRRAVSRIIPNRQRGLPDDSGEAISPNLNGENTVQHNPFKIDFNSVSDFYIVLDNPHNSWLPGDEVSGQIILISKKNLANIVITLSLTGYVKINTSAHSKLRPVKHNLFHHTIKIYGNDNMETSNPNEFSNGLYKGEHRFPFIVKLPNKRVFTSLDFGKGSITYLLKASMTDSNQLQSSPNSPNSSDSPSSPGSNLLFKARNLKILNNANYTSEKLISIINPIDVSNLLSPKPKKLIIKDPRFNRKLSRTQSATSTNTFNTFSTFSSNNSDSNDVSSSNTPNRNFNNNNSNPPSADHNNSNNYMHDANGSMNDEEAIANTPSSVTYDSSRPETIRVSLAIPQRGYLRGESIPIKLNISHLRKIQDVNGIILTFVRVCRLDNGPEGLYDSFRKDLSQLIIPLYVDPNTFKSEINTSMRVPADAFPTISGCPLVSFQYFIEVLINLSGKRVLLENNDQTKSSVSQDSNNTPMIDFPGSTSGNDDGMSENRIPDTINDFKLQFKYLSNATNFNQKERSGFVNTDKYKRMKKFLQLTTEVVIGTHRLNVPASHEANSNFNRIEIQNNASNSPISGRSSSMSDSSPAPLNQNTLYQQHAQTPSQPPSSAPQINVIPESSEINNFGTPMYSEDGSNSRAQHNSNDRVPEYDAGDGGIDLMPMPDQNHLSEKERVRAHESSLLPSEPGGLGMDEPESRESVSPIERNNTLLENYDERSINGSQINREYSYSDTNDQNNGAIREDDNGATNQPHQQGDGMNGSFGFFSTHDSSSTFDDAHTSHHHEGNDQYSDIDYVPNYESARDDRLVQGDNNK